MCAFAIDRFSIRSHKNQHKNKTRAITSELARNRRTRAPAPPADCRQIAIDVARPKANYRFMKDRFLKHRHTSARRRRPGTGRVDTTARAAACSHTIYDLAGPRGPPRPLHTPSADSLAPRPPAQDYTSRSPTFLPPDGTRAAHRRPTVSHRSVEICPPTVLLFQIEGLGRQTPALTQCESTVAEADVTDAGARFVTDGLRVLSEAHGERFRLTSIKVSSIKSPVADEANYLK
ncbi:hypothetical protein EVAR_98983_1 [Eumeta japonica]|uniref:Uncharacterized protein n=1 Tax=Eumeta variegata TaxID=151549 RepID=A0A4C1YQU2_EUMVA|nr:hypothetical protein EVAR_98983_1 [Eumeta japonica]